jgi:hypothetical protein
LETVEEKKKKGGERGNMKGFCDRNGMRRKIM